MGIATENGEPSASIDTVSAAVTSSSLSHRHVPAVTSPDEKRSTVAEAAASSPTTVVVTARRHCSSPLSPSENDAAIAIADADGGEDDKKKTEEDPSTTSASTEATTTTLSFRLTLLACLVVQNSSIVLVGRYTRSTAKNPDDLFVVRDLILVTEVMKFFASFLLEAYTTRSLTLSIRRNIVDRPFDCLRMSVPALLYLLQNSLCYSALTHLSAPLFQVTRQSKLLATAIVSVVMLGRRYTIRQWVCLLALGVGVAIVVLSEDGEMQREVEEDGELIAAGDGGEAVAESSSSSASAAKIVAASVPTTPAGRHRVWRGLAEVTVACFSSAFAGVYFEKVVKRPGGAGTQKSVVSLWMRNVQLAFFSVCIALVQTVHEKRWDVAGSPGGAASGGGGGTGRAFLHGFTFWVWMLALLQVGGGLLIAAVIKYADNVVQGLATGVGVAVSTFCSMVLFGTPLTGKFVVGSIVIVGSVYNFSTAGKKTTSRGDDGEGIVIPDKKIEEGPGRDVVETKPMLLPK